MPLAAQRGTADVKGSIGWTGFLDESSENHLLVAGSLRYYLTRRISLEPEIQYLRQSSTHDDWVFLPNINADLGRGRVVPYVSIGLGVARSRYSRFTDTEAFLSGGGGVKVYLDDRWFIAPEFRIGWEPHARFSVGIGRSWRP
jgi:hypothetical protein